VAVDPTNLPGLRYEVHIDGTLNDPSDTDTGWSVELALPWTDLAQFNSNQTPPAPGDEWRMNLMRIEWNHEVADGEYRKGEEQDFWVWSPQYVVDMHKPEQWGVLEFR
jgi:hypothetical protein